MRDPGNSCDTLKHVVAKTVFAELLKQPDRDGLVKWADAHGPFLYPNQAQELEIDQNLAAMGVPFDHPKFFEKTLADVRSPEKTVAMRALRLLERYAPTGPKSGTADAWEKWWKENQSFLFSSDDGIY